MTELEQLQVQELALHAQKQRTMQKRHSGTVYGVSYSNNFREDTAEFILKHSKRIIRNNKLWFVPNQVAMSLYHTLTRTICVRKETLKNWISKYLNIHYPELQNRYVVAFI